ncbi:MAG: helix-hairpin-helix domain-containing protein [Gemmatimonas sp.]
MRNPTPRRRSTRGKAANASEVREFTDIPNIGPSMSQDFALLGFSAPSQLVGQDPYGLYDRLCVLTHCRQDPCVADVFIAAVRFMEGAPSVPWWHYTAERKQAFKRRQ